MLTATVVSLFVGPLKQAKIKNVYIHTLIDIPDNYINPFNSPLKTFPLSQKFLSCSSPINPNQFPFQYHPGATSALIFFIIY